MTHRAAYEMSEQAADAICAAHGTSFSGRPLARESATVISYYASHKDHAKFAAMVAKYRAPVAPKETTADAATQKQVAFLSRLIADDPGMAATVGAHTRPTLTKMEASRLIDLMKRGV